MTGRSSYERVASAGSIIGIGIDVADVTRFDGLLRRSGHRFTQRWFSQPEMARCQSVGSEPARDYALCYAAKEAVWKALRQDGASTAVPWRMITVLLSDDRRAATIDLSGALHESGERSGVRSISVGLCAFGDICLATAIVES